MAVFHWIDVHVINMVREIVFVPDLVFPETSLPDAAFTFCRSSAADVLALLNGARETCFDQHPAGREIFVIRWQCPYRMHVIG